MCKNAVKKLSFLIRCVPDQYKTQKLCHEVIVENGGTWKFGSDKYKNKKVCNQTVASYVCALECVLIAIKLKKCVVKLKIVILLQYNLFLIDI